VAVTATVRELLARQDNDYDRATTAVLRERGLAAAGVGWHEVTPPHLCAGPGVSVVIPARNACHSLPTVLDALAAQYTAAAEVVVVDDASADATGEIAAAHPVTSAVLRLREHAGSGAARNAGTLLAHADTVAYLDADMVMPPHVLGDLAARSHPDLVLVGFRHNLAHQAGPGGRARLPAGEPDLDADHRVRWRPPAGAPLFYTGMVLDTTITGRPLDDTGEFRALGHGRRYHDWDLPRMVVTALVAVPRARVVAVGGFDPSFAAGWGCDDTYLGALLIADGAKVVPLRQARAWHVDPPDAAAAWRAKYATAAGNVARYRRLLDRPMPPAGRAGLTAAGRLLAEGTRLK
jgi:glycosyltransferase involved in cell wall biosynthesis